MSEIKYEVIWDEVEYDCEFHDTPLEVLEDENEINVEMVDEL